MVTTAVLAPATRSLLARIQLASLLEYICQAIEPTTSEYADAEEKYGAVANWLTGSEQVLLQRAHLYPQGSFALDTAVRPLEGGELDVDLIIRLAGVSPETLPARVKTLFGTRLREHAVYREIMEQMARCWRLNYSGRFHLDMTPTILNPNCTHGGELVPDKRSGEWKATNPGGYRVWFEKQASLTPMLVAKKDFAEGVRAQIEALPAQTPLKGVLRRVVQLLKRHRVKYFEGPDAELAPISIVITTLAAHSYAEATMAAVYETEYDFVQAVVHGLPNAPHADLQGGKALFDLPNPTTEGENFCEKWNLNPELADVFLRWHRSVVRDLARLIGLAGIDQTRRELGYSFGEKAAAAAFGSMNLAVTESRKARSLWVAPGTGLTISATPGSVRPWHNTYYGRRSVRVRGQRRLSLGEQLATLRLHPLTRGGTGRHVGGRLTWEFDGSPSPLSRIYRLRVDYIDNRQPRIYVISPKLPELAAGRPLPHVYSERPLALCLFHPRYGEWMPSMGLVESVVTWAITWLFFFEDWLATDEWKGGG